MSVKNSTYTSTKEETASAVLQRLELAYKESSGVLSELKIKQVKLQEQMLAAQDESFKAYQQFTNTKENYLLSIIQQQKTATAEASVEVVDDKTRSNNVDSNN
jgi:hypothetical protein